MTRFMSRTLLRSVFLAVVAMACGLAACSKAPSVEPQDSPRLLDAIAADEVVRLGIDEEELVEEWILDDGAEGWAGSSDVAELRLGSPLTFRSTGIDAFVFRDGLSLDAALIDRIDIKLGVSSFVTMPRLYWKTADRPQFDESMSAQITMPRDAREPTVVSIRVAGHATWNGTITGLRIDPTDVAGASVTMHYVEAYAEPYETRRRTSVLVGSEWRRVRVAPTGDDWTVAIRTEAAQHLSLGTAPLPYSTNLGAGELRFRVDVVGGSERSLFDERVVLDPSLESYGFTDHDIVLEPSDTIDDILTLRFRVDGTLAREDSGATGKLVDSKLAGLWAAPTLHEGVSADVAPLNLVVFSLDTLRADRLGCYGYGKPTSPIVDELAARGTVFTQASSQAPETLASHMSIMTGRMPSAHAVFGDLDALADNYDTIAKSLLAKGYHTAAYTEGGYIDGHFGFHAGFQRYHNGSGPTPESPGGDVERTFARGREWLDRFGKEAFFLFLHTYEIHVPYAPPAEFRKFGPIGYDGPFLDQTIDHHKHIIPINTGELKTDEVDKQYIEGLYDGEIAYTDREVGRVLAHLKELGVADRTVVVILSDHGEEFDEHGVFGMHGHSLHEEMVHVPLILAGPGIANGRRIDDAVGLYDLYPTLADLFGFDAPSDLEGRSLASLLNASASPPSDRELRTIVSEDGTVYPRISLREGSWRYVKTFGVESWWVDQLLALGSPEIVQAFLDVTETELYDLSKDPGARKNLSTVDDARLQAFQELLDVLAERSAAVRDRYGAERGAGAELDPSKIDQLNKLGYLSGDSSQVYTIEEVRARLEAFLGEVTTDAASDG